MSFGVKNKKPEPLFIEYILGATSSASAAVLTHPMDLIKVRQQIQRLVVTADARNLSSFSIFTQIAKQEGLGGLYKGLTASLLRQFTYSGARIASYPFIKNMLQQGNDYLSLERKILAGMLAGAIGAVFGNPADLINVRMQADVKLAPEKRRNYKNVFHGIVSVAKDEGLLTLWRGSKPNVVRAMFMTASQLASYDHIKQLLLKTSIFKDDLITHFSAGSIAGIIATVVTQPVDVVKTRLMYTSKEGALYRGVLDCFIKTFQSEGFVGLYRGFGPAATRLVPQTIFTFVFYEQYARLLGMLRGSNNNSSNDQEKSSGKQ